MPRERNIDDLADQESHKLAIFLWIFFALVQDRLNLWAE